MSPTKKEVEQGYTVSDWHGHRNLECVFCPYSTLDESDMKKHQWVHQQDVNRKPKEAIAEETQEPAATVPPAAADNEEGSES